MRAEPRTNAPAEPAPAAARTPPARKANSARDLVLLVSVMVLWALCYPLITLGLSFAPHLSFATLRALVAGLALAIMAYLLRRPLPRSFGIWAVLAAIGISTTSLGFLGMFHAAEFVSPGLATVITNGQPLIAAILAHLFLRERLSLMQRLGLLLGFLGIVAISLPQFGAPAREDFAVGVTYIVLAAGGVACGNVLIKALGGRVDPLLAMAAQSLFGAVPLGVGAVIRERPDAIVWSPTFIASLLGLALFGTALAYWLWFMLLERIELSRANAFTFLTPFIGFAIGVAFFGDSAGLAAVTGLSLTAAGVLLVERGARLSAAAARL